ncbi:MAG: GGDEF domain-containing protein [Vampirovibrionia bacterium]
MIGFSSYSLDKKPLKRQVSFNERLSFGSIRDDLNDKLRNISRIEEINHIREQLDLCNSMADQENVSDTFKTALNNVFAEMKCFLDKTVFWNTSIQVSNIYNWSYMKQKGPEIILAANRNDPNSKPKTVCMVVIDVDNLKKINTKFGSVLAGNEVVNHIARTLTLVFPDDIVTKFGGDEFFVLLSDTSIEKTVEKVKQISKVIAENKPMFADQEIPYTVSAGVCVHEGRFVDKDEEIGELVAEAKSKFRNLAQKSIDACIDKAKMSDLKGVEDNIIVANTKNKIIYQYSNDEKKEMIQLLA